jgi:hypothetical protein
MKIKKLKLNTLKVIVFHLSSAVLGNRKILAHLHYLNVNSFVGRATLTFLKVEKYWLKKHYSTEKVLQKGTL